MHESQILFSSFHSYPLNELYGVLLVHAITPICLEIIFGRFVDKAYSYTLPEILIIFCRDVGKVNWWCHVQE